MIGSTSEISRDLIGTSGGKKTFSYGWRDVILYALAVGVKEDELRYLYEKNLLVLPSFGAIPHLATFGAEPYTYLPDPIVTRILKPMPGFAAFHMAHEVILHKPISPLGGTFDCEDKITDVFDRGSGKGVVVRSALTLTDKGGEKVSTSIYDFWFGGYTSLGSNPPPKSIASIPDSPPDIITEDYISSTQHLLYRLCGDTNLPHVDPEFAAQMHTKPFMQGLCTWGFGVHHTCKAILPDQADRVRKIGGQFRNIVFPGTKIAVHIWKQGETKAVFRVIDLEHDKIAIENGYVIWE